MEDISFLIHRKDIKLGFKFKDPRRSNNEYMIIGITVELIKKFEEQKTTIKIISLNTKEINTFTLIDNSDLEVIPI